MPASACTVGAATPRRKSAVKRSWRRGRADERAPHRRACANARTPDEDPTRATSPLLRSSDECVALALACVRESSAKLRRERNDPLMPRLRGRRLSTAHALASDELAAREIDVPPSEPADLPCPKPRMGGEQEGEPMAGRRHGEDAGDILVGERVRRRALFLRAFVLARGRPRTDEMANRRRSSARDRREHLHFRVATEPPLRSVRFCIDDVKDQPPLAAGGSRCALS
jgi:hypothetical protein